MNMLILAEEITNVIPVKTENCSLGLEGHFFLCIKSFRCVFPCQSLTFGRCPRLEVPYPREVMVTAARTMPPVGAYMFMEAIKHYQRTNMALSMTSTAMMSTSARGKPIHTFICFLYTCNFDTDLLWHSPWTHLFCVPGSFSERVAIRGTSTLLCSSAALSSSLAATHTTTRHSAMGPSVSLLTFLHMILVGLKMTSLHFLNQKMKRSIV